MRTGLCSIMLIALGVSTLSATVPPTMNYQSLLTNSLGDPVVDGGYSVTFSIYSSATGGSPLWMETQTVMTSNGLFNTILGSTTPIPDTAVMDTAAYLEISVETDPPLSPRTRLTSTAYSVVSSAMLGRGPIMISHDDGAGGAESIYSVDVKPESGTGKHIHRRFAVFAHFTNDTTELDEVVGLSGSTKSAVAIPAFMKNARKAKTAASAESREILDIDSGYAHSVAIELPGDTTELLEIASASGTSSAAVAIPAFMKNARKAKNSESAGLREILDTDSGYVEQVYLGRSDGRLQMLTQLSPPSTAAIAIPNLIEARKGSNEAGDTVETREILDIDSGYSHTARLTPNTGFGSVMKTGMNQTREHILLARQVGAASEQSVELKTENTGPTITMTKDGTAADPLDDGVVVLTGSLPGAAALSVESSKLDDLSSYQVETKHADGARAQLLRGNGADTSEIEMSVDDTEQSVTMSTTATGTKWPNIVLKRGATATEMTISHVSAGATGVIYATASAAAGAQLGINTSSPTSAFHLVGSGCYTGTFGVCSDKRYKDHIETLSDPIDAVNRLRGVSFAWKRDQYPDNNFPEGKQLGLIAQEVEQVVPGVVNTGSDGYKSVDYAKLVPLLIEAVKEQQRQIRAQQDQIDDLRSELRTQTP